MWRINRSFILLKNPAFIHPCFSILEQGILYDFYVILLIYWNANSKKVNGSFGANYTPNHNWSFSFHSLSIYVCHAKDNATRPDQQGWFFFITKNNRFVVCAIPAKFILYPIYTTNFVILGRKHTQFFFWSWENELLRLVSSNFTNLNFQFQLSLNCASWLLFHHGMFYYF